MVISILDQLGNETKERLWDGILKRDLRPHSPVFPCLYW